MSTSAAPRSSRSDGRPRIPAIGRVVADVPLPPAAVTFDLPCGDVPEIAVADVVDRVTQHWPRAAQAVSPSPYVTRPPRRAVPVPSTTASGSACRPPGLARIARSDGTAVTADTPVSDEDGARLVVARLEHIARWEQVRALGDHPSTLHGAVEIDVFDAADGETFRPDDRQPIPSTGDYHLSYRTPEGGPPQPPLAVHRGVQRHRRAPLGGRARPHRPLPVPRRAPDRRCSPPAIATPLATAL